MPLDTKGLSAVNAAAHDSGDADSRYLIFSLGGEAYATPLACVREVLKPSAIKAVPFVEPHFKGVLNLRGQILSVLDVREKLGLSAPAPGNLLLVVERGADRVVGIVDDVLAVANFAGGVERTPPIDSRVPLAFILGIARWGDGLVSVIDIVKALSQAELTAVRNAVG